MFVLPQAAIKDGELPPILLAPVPGGSIPLRRITVLTVAGHPHFYVSLRLTAEDIEAIIEQRHGRQEGGHRHLWLNGLRDA